MVRRTPRLQHTLLERVGVGALLRSLDLQGLLTIIKKVKAKEKEMRLLMV